MAILTLVVPAYNEEKRVGRLVESLCKSSFLLENAEIIFVVDGKDKTADVIGLEKGKMPCRIIESEKRLGKGGAVWLGFSQAKTDYVGFVDADGPVSMEELEAMAKKCIGSVDTCVIASRRMENRGGLRKFSSIVFNLLVKTLFGIGEKDTQCGCKILPKKLLEGKPFLISGFAFDVELLRRARKGGGRVEEYSISRGEVGGGGFSILDAPAMLFDLVRLKLSGG